MKKILISILSVLICSTAFSQNKLVALSFDDGPNTTTTVQMLDVLKKDPKASFFFIGAEDEKDEPGRTTRRFRVYHRFVSSVVGETVFEHHRNNELSLYILVNKQYVEDIPQLTQKITDYVSKSMQPLVQKDLL